MQEKDIKEKLNQELDKMAPDILEKVLAKPIEPIESEENLFNNEPLFEEKKDKDKYLWIPQVIAVVACLVLVAVLSSIWFKPNVTPTAPDPKMATAFTITIDVNPSITMKVKKDNTVESIKASNKDAKKVVKKVKKKLKDDTTYGEAVEMVVSGLKKKGYLKKDNSAMLVSVVTEDGKAGKEKLKEVKAEGVLIGEVWEDASNKYSYNRRREYLFGSELDSVTNYPLRQIILDLVRNYIGNRYFIKKYMSLKENYPKEYFYSTMNILGNHDTERVLTILNNNISLLKLAVVIQMTLPGVPLIYYGDEAGLTGGKDPYNRKAYPWGKENKDILNFYTKISNIRASEEALKSGEIKFLDFNNEVLGYERLIGNEKIVVVVNTMEKKENISLYDVNDGNTVIDLMSNDKKYEVKNSQIEIELKSHEYKILKIL